jgi:hypothetical protein
MTTLRYGAAGGRGVAISTSAAAVCQECGQSGDTLRRAGQLLVERWLHVINRQAKMARTTW